MGSSCSISADIDIDSPVMPKVRAKLNERHEHKKQSPDGDPHHPHHHRTTHHHPHPQPHHHQRNEKESPSFHNSPSISSNSNSNNNNALGGDSPRMSPVPRMSHRLSDAWSTSSCNDRDSTCTGATFTLPTPSPRSGQGGLISSTSNNLLEVHSRGSFRKQMELASSISGFLEKISTVDSEGDRNRSRDSSPHHSAARSSPGSHSLTQHSMMAELSPQYPRETHRQDTSMDEMTSRSRLPSSEPSANGAMTAATRSSAERQSNGNREQSPSSVSKDRISNTSSQCKILSRSYDGACTASLNSFSSSVTSSGCGSGSISTLGKAAERQPLDLTRYIESQCHPVMEVSPKSSCSSRGKLRDQDFPLNPTCRQGSFSIVGVPKQQHPVEYASLGSDRGDRGTIPSPHQNPRHDHEDSGNRFGSVKLKTQTGHSGGYLQKSHQALLQPDEMSHVSSLLSLAEASKSHKVV